MSKRYYRVPTIAGSDIGGGAGIQADLKTFSALGCYGMSVITSLTAQNTKEVTAIHAVPPSFVREQMEAVFSDIGVDAVKIGMLYSDELIETVTEQLKSHQAKNIVLDPVMVAKSGDRLLKDDKTVEAMKKHLMPLATVITPNLPEASTFLNRSIQSPDDMQHAARELAQYGSKNILIKGGHLDEQDSSDLLFITTEERFVVLKGERIATRNNHGTGCTFSSAIASFLAKELPLEESVKLAKEYITEALREGAEYEIGDGHGPVHHFYRTWPES